MVAIWFITIIVNCSSHHPKQFTKVGAEKTAEVVTQARLTTKRGHGRSIGRLEDWTNRPDDDHKPDARGLDVS